MLVLNTLAKKVAFETDGGVDKVRTYRPTEFEMLTLVLWYRL